MSVWCSQDEAGSAVGMDCPSVDGSALKDNSGGSLAHSDYREQYAGKDQIPVHRSQVMSASSRGKQEPRLEGKKCYGSGVGVGSHHTGSGRLREAHSEPLRTWKIPHVAEHLLRRLKKKLQRGK